MNGRKLASMGRMAAGPLALAGFFLPWAHGPGVFAANEFTGFTLLGFAGRLQTLELSWLAGGALWAARLSLLGLVIAGGWQTLLAPAHHWHRGYDLSGWYLTAFTLVAVAIGIAKSGVVLPQPGIVLLGVASILFVVGRRTIPR